MSEIRSKQTDALLKEYMNSGDFGKKNMEKKYPHINFKELLKEDSIENYVIEEPAMEGAGEILAQGSGQGHSEIGSWVFICLLGASLSLIAAFWMNSRQNLAAESQNIFIIFFIALGVWYIINAAVTHSSISNSYIKVYEGGVTGKGLSKWFHIGDIRSFDFMLTYDQISVDLNGKHIMVNAPGANYKVYVSNGAEIQQAIHKQKSQIAAAKSIIPNGAS